MIALVLALILTLVSLAEYGWRSRDLFSER